MLKICYSIGLYGKKKKFKERCKSNESQNVNSDYSPNITPAFQSNSKSVVSTTHWLPMSTCKSVRLCEGELNYLQNPFKHNVSTTYPQFPLISFKMQFFDIV